MLKEVFWVFVGFFRYSLVYVFVWEVGGYKFIGMIVDRFKILVIFLIVYFKDIINKLFEFLRFICFFGDSRF